MQTECSVLANPTTRAILPAISYLLRVKDSSLGLILNQKLVTTGYCAVVTHARRENLRSRRLTDRAYRPHLELAIREVGHKTIMKTLNTRMEEVEESQRGEHKLSILRQAFCLSQKATEEEWSSFLPSERLY